MSTTVNRVTYTLDNNRNLLSGGVNIYTYTSNKLSSISVENLNGTFQYSGLGDRLSQTVNGVTTNYTLDLNTGLTQVLQDGTNTYVYGVDRIAQFNGAATEYFLPDALGSVRQLVDSAGNITLAKNYEPYGMEASTAGSGLSSYGFTGEMTDSYIKLIYLRSRFYASGMGRFLTRDTWAGDYQNPLTLNAWNYTSSNPVNYTDPTGKFANFPGCPFFLYNTLDCLSWYGAIPDYKGLVIVELYKSSFDKAAGEIMAAGLHPTTIAAAIAIQSQWLDYPIDQLQNALYLLKNSGCNNSWINEQLKSSSLGFAQMGEEEIEEFGSPFSMANSIKAMTARIRNATSKCRNCAPIDIQIIAGMAQNGGFGFYPYMERTYKDKITGRIDWNRYFSSDENKPYLTDDLLDVFNNNRAGWRSNFDTRFQLQLFTQDMMALTNIFGWGLPQGVDQRQLVSMWNLAFWGRE